MLVAMEVLQCICIRACSTQSAHFCRRNNTALDVMNDPVSRIHFGRLLAITPSAASEWRL